MKKITMYTGPLCNYCEAAKRLLARNNAPYNEIDILASGKTIIDFLKKHENLVQINIDRQKDFVENQRKFNEEIK